MYRYYPFKLEDYDYGIQLLDLGSLQMLMERFDQSRKTFTEVDYMHVTAPLLVYSAIIIFSPMQSIEVLSVVVGPHHPLTVLARKSQDIVARKLHLRH